MKKKKALLSAGLAVLAVLALFWAASHFRLLPWSVFYAEDFGIATLSSGVDFDGDGVDDYTDLMLGAREDAKNHPKYDGAYWDGGFPPDNVGVCTDVVWRAFRNAGYDLREMVDRDIARRPAAYPYVIRPDKNIDFRRVRNLRVFFEKYGVSLTLDAGEIAAWQPGDLVIFGTDEHIGVISDRRNRNGRAYLIHNGGQLRREEDSLDQGIITGHYRFDASRIDPNLLIPWGN